jgi:cytochrome c oxidase assembly protein subunit 15
MNQSFHRLAMIAAILAFLVIVLGAYVRLSHAGLGCPDWPGCYGQLSWPNATHEIQSANEAFPERPVESHKAWKEMVHRYLAGTLVLLVVALNWMAWRNPAASAFRLKTGVLLGLILFQAALGMWTVTLKLLPVVVMGHLLGGLATLALLIWIIYSNRYAASYQPGAQLRSVRSLIVTALIVLTLQIALGGWTSSNYAAMSCPDFPTCQGEMWPDTNFREGFILWREIGVDFEGGVLDLPSRTAIHMAHRIGAIITFFVLVFAAFKLTRVSTLQRSGLLLLALTCTQVLLGILNVVLHLPLVNAVAHNGVAALLLAVLVGLVYRTAPGRQGL